MEQMQQDNTVAQKPMDTMQSPGAPKQDNKKLAIITIVFTVILALVAGGAYLLGSNQSDSGDNEDEEMKEKEEMDEIDEAMEESDTTEENDEDTMTESDSSPALETFSVDPLILKLNIGYPAELGEAIVDFEDELSGEMALSFSDSEIGILINPQGLGGGGYESTLIEERTTTDLGGVEYIGYIYELGNLETGEFIGYTIEILNFDEVQNYEGYPAITIYYEQPVEPSSITSLADAQAQLDLIEIIAENVNYYGVSANR
jgi:hypothetical protein